MSKHVSLVALPDVPDDVKTQEVVEFFFVSRRYVSLLIRSEIIDYVHTEITGYFGERERGGHDSPAPH